MSAFKPIVKSIFSPSHVFLLILSGFLALFLVSNVSNVLIAMGFETKAAIKANLVETKTQLKAVTELNNQNALALKEEREVNVQMRAQIAEVGQKSLQAEKTVTVIKEKKVQRDAPVVQRIVEKTVVTDTTITLPTAEINTLSASNIEQVHDVFNALFPVA